MRKKKFTKGQWIMCRDGSGYFVCNETRGESGYNYNLISAAPELLEALEALDAADRLYDIDHESSIAKMVKAAIAKAYGE